MALDNILYVNTASVAVFDATGSVLNGVSFFGTASAAVSASWAPIIPSTFSVSSSWASASLSSSTSLTAISASFSAITNLQNISTTASNANLYIAFVVNTGSQAEYITSSLTVNPASGSITATLFNGNVTGSLFGTASNSVSSSFAFSSSNTVSSSYVFSASNANRAITASYFSMFPLVKSGIISASLFTGNPLIVTASFATPMPNTFYAVSIVGGDARSWTVEFVSASNFTISTNSRQALTDFVRWTAIGMGESS